MNYELKDKINTTKEFIAELEAKSWQEIEHLQAQINNLADGITNNKLRQLFNNLLTSYYIFVGGIENLAGEPIQVNNKQKEQTTEEPQVEIVQEPVIDNQSTLNTDSTDDFNVSNAKDEDDHSVREPFEYFVDFDDPVGEPITDEDLYNS